jgi:hypothetical protein
VAVRDASRACDRSRTAASEPGRASPVKAGFLGKTTWCDAAPSYWLVCTGGLRGAPTLLHQQARTCSHTIFSIGRSSHKPWQTSALSERCESRVLCIPRKASSQVSQIHCRASPASQWMTGAFPICCNGKSRRFHSSSLNLLLLSILSSKLSYRYLPFTSNHLLLCHLHSICSLLVPTTSNACQELPRGRKRSCGNGQVNGGITVKRARRTLRNEISLTTDQQAIIELAAKTFQISPDGLLDAINDLKATSRLRAPDFSTHGQPSTPLSMEEELFESARPSFSQSSEEGSPPVDNLTPAETQGHQIQAASGMSPTSPRRDSLFGFQLEPGPWEDCFASLFPWGQQGPHISGGASQSGCSLSISIF